MLSASVSAASESKRLDLIHLYSDYHKEAYGYRPRGVDYSSFTLAELEGDYARFARVCKENEEAEAVLEKRAQEQFEADIAGAIKAGAADRITAIRWLFDGWLNGVDIMTVRPQDIEHYLWSTGIGYKACKELTPQLAQAVYSLLETA